MWLYFPLLLKTRVVCILIYQKFKSLDYILLLSKKRKKQNKFKVQKVKHYCLSENYFITTNRFSKCKFIHQNVIPLPFNRQYYDYDVLKILFITEQVLASCNKPAINPSNGVKSILKSHSDFKDIFRCFIRVKVVIQKWH